MELTDIIAAERIVGKMQLHIVQYRQGFCTITRNGLCVAKQRREIGINVDGMGRILQSKTPSA